MQMLLMKFSQKKNYKLDGKVLYLLRRLLEMTFMKASKLLTTLTRKLSFICSDHCLMFDGVFTSLVVGIRRVSSWNVANY